MKAYLNYGRNRSDGFVGFAPVMGDLQQSARLLRPRLGSRIGPRYCLSMLRKLLNTFRATQDAPLPQPDAQLALGALMVRVAKSDHSYKLSEIQQIDRLLARLYDLNPVEAAKMRATCEKLDIRAPHTDTFAALIRDGLDHAHWLAALEALCEVMLADGTAHTEEMEEIHATRVLLGLDEDDLNEALSRIGGPQG